MGYGASARRSERLNPKYFNPEFNRKAAWKIHVIPPGPAEIGSTWDDGDESTEYDVEVQVYDWQQHATVYSNPVDFENAPVDNIYESSNVAHVSIEIPGMTNTLLLESTPISGTGTPNDPLVYIFSIANENLLEAGQYSGVVKVTDGRSSSSDWVADQRDFIIDTPDGIQLNNHNIPEYASYQIFCATVLEAEIFVDPPGEILWAKSAVGLDDEIGYGIAALTDGAKVVTGYFRDRITFAPGELNETELISAGQNDLFIASYDSTGTLTWVKRVGASGWESSFGITALSDNSVVITGIFGWTVVFGQGEANQTTLQNYPNDGVFIARYNPDGTLQWAKSISGNGPCLWNGSNITSR